MSTYWQRSLCQKKQIWIDTRVMWTHWQRSWCKQFTLYASENRCLKARWLGWCACSNRWDLAELIAGNLGDFTSCVDHKCSPLIGQTTAVFVGGSGQLVNSILCQDIPRTHFFGTDTSQYFTGSDEFWLRSNVIYFCEIISNPIPGFVLPWHDQILCHISCRYMYMSIWQ